MADPSARQFDGIQILRGLAALLVVVHHVLETSAPLLLPQALPAGFVVWGAIGVDVFFVISGFIMVQSTGTQFGQRGAALEFLARRCIRIFPLYWLCTLAIVALVATTPLFGERAISVPKFISSIALLPLAWPIIEFAWTLQFEMYFYVIFALWLALGSRQGALVGAPLTLAGVSAAATLLPSGYARQMLTNPIAAEFVLGMWIAGAMLSRQLGVSTRGLLLVAGVAGSMLAVGLAPIDPAMMELVPSVRFWVWGPPAALIVAATVPLAQVRSRLGLACVRLGDASYALYLTHYVIIAGYGAVAKAPAAGLLPPLAWMLLATLASVVLGTVAHRHIERPATAWAKRQWQMHGARVHAWTGRARFRR